MKAKLGWKVPFRQVYCFSFVDWLRQTFWCHVVIKVFPNAIDLGGDPLVPHYKNNPKMFYEQYEFAIDRVQEERDGAPPSPRPRAVLT